MKSGRLDITVKPFGPLPSATHTAIEDEAHALGPVRDTKTVTVAFAESSSTSQ